MGHHPGDSFRGVWQKNPWSFGDDEHPALQTTLRDALVKQSRLATAGELTFPHPRAGSSNGVPEAAA